MSLKNILFSFTGRIPRQTFWLSMLGLFAGGILAGMLVGIISAMTGDTVARVTENAADQTTAVAQVHYSPVGVALFLLVYILLVWMSLALHVKRWHDRDKVGWWVFIVLIPLVGPIWSFVEVGCLPGTAGPNRFGADPLAK